MNLINALPLTKNKLDILLKIYINQEDYLRNLEREVNLNPSLLHRYLMQLSNAGVIVTHKKGKEVYYSLVEDEFSFWSNFLENYHAEKTIQQHKDLKILYNLFKGNKRISTESNKIMLFGSFVNGEVNKNSDIDILFVTKSKKLILEWCREASLIIGRTVNPLIYLPIAFEKEIKAKEAMLSSIVNNIKNRIILK